MGLKMTTLAQKMTFNAHPEGGRLIAATRAEARENQANKTFLEKAAALGQVSRSVPLTLQR